MIIFLKTGGEVAYVSDENINLGSDKANSLFVVAPYASASSVCVVFKLPNGKTLGPGFVENQGSVTFYPEDSVYVMQKNGSIPGYFFDGQSLSAWSYDIQSALTGVSGTLGIQLFIFADGRCISTNLINVPINVGVNNITLPSEPTEEGDIFHDIIRYLTETNTYMTSVKQEAAASANEARAWANGTYVDEEGNSQPVAEGTEQYQKNAEYYAEQAAGSAASAENYAEVIAPRKAEEAANTVLDTVNNRLDTLETEMDSAEDRLDNAEDRLDNAEDRLDNVDYILEQFGAVKAQVDSSEALVKSIPARSDLFAYLNSVGGKTEKYNQLLTNTFWYHGDTVKNGQTIEHNGGTIKNNGDGTYTFNGTFESIWLNLFLSTPTYNPDEYNLLPITPNANIYVSLKNPWPSDVTSPFFSIFVRDTKDETSVPYNAGGFADGDLFINGGAGASFSSEKKYISDLGFGCNGGTFNNYVFAPMFNLGTSALPWQSPADPFTGLRSGKVTDLKVYGANLLDVSKCVNKCFVDNGDGTYTIKGVGTDRFSEWASVQIPANTSFYVAAKTVQEASKIINIQAKLADGTTPTIRGLSEAIAVKKFTLDVVGVRFYIQGTGTNADGVYGVYSDFWLSLANVGYFPYKAEPTTYAIPEAVQALDGYGEGFYNVYNRIRQNRITFDGVGAATYTKSCSRLILNGSEDWEVSPSKADTFVLHWGVTTEFGYTSEYEQFKSYDLAGTTNGIYMSNSSFAYITDKRYTTVEEFKAHLAEKPLIVLYSTKNPEITDISAELAGFDPVIPVEGGGQIEFVNDNNYDVPSTITYNIIQEAAI